MIFHAFRTVISKRKNSHFAPVYLEIRNYYGA